MDREWSLIEPYVPKAKRGGRPEQYPIEFHLKWFTMGVYDLATTIPYPESM